LIWRFDLAGSRTRALLLCYSELAILALCLLSSHLATIVGWTTQSCNNFARKKEKKRERKKKRKRKVFKMPSLLQSLDERRQQLLIEQTSKLALGKFQ
jgi:hypothetical protein